MKICYFLLRDVLVGRGGRPLLIKGGIRDGFSDSHDPKTR